MMMWTLKQPKMVSVYMSLVMRKTGLRGFRPGPTQTGVCGHRRRLEACNFRFRKKRDYTIYVAKTKALISFAVTAKLICVFVFAYVKSRFSHDEAHIFSDRHLKIPIATIANIYDKRVAD